MSKTLFSTVTRRGACVFIERSRLQTCPASKSDHWCTRRVGQFAAANQNLAQKFNRLKRAWVFPLFVVDAENARYSTASVRNRRTVVTSARMDNYLVEKINRLKDLTKSMADSSLFGKLKSFFASDNEQWQDGKQRYVDMPVSEKRSHYQCGTKFTELGSIPSWPQHYRSTKDGAKAAEQTSMRAELSPKVSMWQGDITTLEIDTIVNAANRTLLGGGGVDGAIHRAAGPSLVEECKTLCGCDTGEAKITSGYKLPAKYVIHTVGPQGEQPDKLKNCYRNCLQTMKENKLRTIAFPCISTGIYGYPNEAAAHVALDTTRKWLKEGDNKEKVGRIIFCLFLPEDIKIYERLLQDYFPPE